MRERMRMGSSLSPPLNACRAHLSGLYLLVGLEVPAGGDLTFTFSGSLVSLGVVQFDFAVTEGYLFHRQSFLPGICAFANRRRQDVGHLILHILNFVPACSANLDLHFIEMIAASAGSPEFRR